MIIIYINQIEIKISKMKYKCFKMSIIKHTKKSLISIIKNILTTYLVLLKNELILFNTYKSLNS
jgi:hypothetical protein